MSVATAPFADRYRHARRIASLDARRDHVEIYRISSGLEFPWDYQRALELALLRTFAVPAIGGLVDATGEFARAGQRRYDDTLVLMAALAKYGYDSPEGRTALRTINRAHGWYTIDNDDMLYTLSAFIYEPIKWLDRFGWRPLLPQERLAAFWFYRNVGSRMNIVGIPSDYAEFERFNQEYERSRFAFTAAGRRVADHAIGVVCHWFPRPSRPLVRRGMLGILDEPLLTAFGHRPPRVLPWVTHRALRVRARAQRLGGPRRRSYYDDPPRVRSYPGTQHDYTVADFGVRAPSPVAAEWSRRPDDPHATRARRTV
ncbi:oxygenase MpaB family protein [Streptomyces alboniger]|uniref:oxygenase MpaB family protein n=1 Tax=Streptomyces alboniger TaxID=132473 RepID=UPI0006E367ED|nr:oxygenase MpaB family protein [Streptomyces alboniger]